MDRGSPSPDRRRTIRAAAVAGVVALHAGLFVAIGLSQVPREDYDVPAPIVVELFTPPLPPPPPPEPTLEPVTPDPGGGAPAAPSIVRPSPRPIERPEVVAPPIPAPEQPLVIGMAPGASPTPGQGQGGVGEGTGSGIGDGDGPGRGGTPPIIMRGPNAAEKMSVVPPQARAARQAGRATASCLVNEDQRLYDCRVISETPAGFGFGEGILRASRYFIYRPATDANGQPDYTRRATVGMAFGRQ